MCTVTLIPTQENGFILTSNRDEAVNRKTLVPEFYQVDKTRMLFPKDAVAGGTWIGLSDKNTMICLLNGGFEIHERLTSYRQSRGVVVKDLLGANNLQDAILGYDYKGIEPFTIVAANWQSELEFFELVWDGKQKHFKTLDKETHIWSSSTLYSAEMKNKRKDWFQVFEQENQLTSDTLLDFHKNAGIGDKDVDLQIDRGFLKTRSITQIVKNSEEELTMRYEDLQKSEVNVVTFEAITA
ncbi:Transport and Golgi organisation 2 [Aquimarina amphilecti]|uniref:Transport and Golgi organisation 2 n=1 Tax=Aquimarina amphilecti TaxID=1038014 RepID=A0A1H7M2X4_AQUAM|nr:NRDE family protein [Aquimarina amphilecti]SEL05573.1 Transport and Golgi organisation 2 [Aquimarina amphilecti]